MNNTSEMGSFQRDGYVLLRGLIPPDAIDTLLNRYLGLVHSVTGRTFSDAFGKDLVDFYNENPKIESAVYVAMRDHTWLEEFSRIPSLSESAGSLIGKPHGLLQKIVFRIDMPEWTAELAHWHQDYFYVRGNTEIVTAWVPLQDTRWDRGCLMVMPGSHAEGPVEHDLKIGKKSIPSSIFSREVRYVEMQKGDVLIFSSLLLHSSSLNVSNSIRYSVQSRYTPLGQPVDPGMGNVLSISDHKG
jgi:phytanoyl-CoA hydroxylase